MGTRSRHAIRISGGIKDVENRWFNLQKGNSNEIGGIFDQSGNMLQEIESEGDIDLCIDPVKAKETGIPYVKPSILKDSVFSHYHPEGGSFSISDIYTGIRLGFSEIRAIDEKGERYILEIPEEVRGSGIVATGMSEGWKHWFRKAYEEGFRHGEIAHLATEKTIREVNEKAGLTKPFVYRRDFAVLSKKMVEAQSTTGAEQQVLVRIDTGEILAVTSGDGEHVRTQLALPKEVNTTDVMVIHTHPTDEELGLSIPDWRGTVQNNIGEMRVVIPSGEWLSVSRPQNGWPSMNGKDGIAYQYGTIKEEVKDSSEVVRRLAEWMNATFRRG